MCLDTSRLQDTLKERQDKNQWRADPEIPTSVIVERRIWWLTVPKAADRSSSNRAED